MDQKDEDLEDSSKEKESWNDDEESKDCDN
jgi:hypothetical protein